MFVVRKFILLLLLYVFSGCSLFSSPAPSIEEIKGTPISNIRYKGPLWLLFGKTNTILGDTLYVYDKKWFLEPKNSLESTIRHECLHIERQRNWGLKTWLALYILSKDFRFEEECLAYELEIEYLTNNDFEVRPHWFAETLSGPDYFWMTDYKTAFQWADKTIEKYKNNKFVPVKE